MQETSKVPVELVSRAMREREAFDDLIVQYRGFVLSLVRPRVVDSSAAEDVAQEVWVIVERELPKLREPRAFLGWLARIAENSATAYLKRTARERDARRELGERNGNATEPPSDGVAIADERQQAVLRALRSLPEDYRIPVTLRFYQGLTAREISEVLNCPLGTVLSRLFRANALMKERLKKYLD